MTTATCKYCGVLARKENMRAHPHSHELHCKDSLACVRRIVLKEKK